MHFEKDYQYLIHLVRCTLQDAQPEEKPENISFENVYSLGTYHEVANIAFLSVDRLQNKPQDALYQAWQVGYYHSIQRDARQAEERERVLSLLHQNGIRTVEAQGTVTKQYYPQPELRMMSDIDIIVDREKLPQVQRLMQDAGYTTENTDFDEVNAINDKGLVIEFHFDFFTDHPYRPKEKYYAAMHDPFEHTHTLPDNPMEYVLEDTYFYLYSLLHTIKHFEYSGCGIRRVMDFYVLNKALGERIDWEYIHSVIDKCGFRNAADRLFALEQYWFEDVAPAIDLKETERDIIKGGLHGSEELLLKNQMKLEKEIFGIQHPKLQRIKDTFIPSKKDIYAAYPVCEERGYSTLMCWIYRFYVQAKQQNIVKAGVDRVKKIIKSR